MTIQQANSEACWRTMLQPASSSLAALLLLLLAAAFAAVYALALGLVLLLSQAAVHGPALYRTVSSLRNYSPHAVLSAGVHAASLGAAPGAG
mmetsp:Transcript_16660/g.48900  ORF Transcript_16660/g.48900 Transcript_16660/m.48900 type:complete len:92 (+) Transcript_16660:1479-1754(+)